ncbi:MAG: hypothetical protein K0U98_11365 [Deltaproteobacteria bacterium]|nr:hypothetical protein [Deltaproteobacteria bacterium]
MPPLVTALTDLGIVQIGANSYASEEEINNHFAASPTDRWNATTLEAFRVKWGLADTLEVVQALARIATRELDLRYPNPRGLISTQDEDRLLFPRLGLVDSQGRNLSGLVPLAVKRAQYALMDAMLEADLREPIRTGGELKRKKIGPIEKEYVVGSRIEESRMFVEVDRLMSSVTRSESSNLQLRRVS